MDQNRLLAFLPQPLGNLPGMVNVAGDHQAPRSAMEAPHLLESVAGLDQQTLGNATPIPRADGPTQVAGPPTLPRFL